MHVAQRFERLLDAYRRQDGTPWTGQKLDEATGGVVTRAYVTNLRKGRIENPGYEKLLAIARAMGFPPALWFEDADLPVPPEGQDLASRVVQLFGTVMHPKTGEPQTDADVARMSAGARDDTFCDAGGGGAFWWFARFTIRTTRRFRR